MGRSALSAVIRRAGADTGEPDAALLERFTASGDQAAFSELVRRHARLVWGRCRVALPCDADADDAFQATFLALARHANSVRDPNRLGPWLHTVAGRVCKNARRAAARRTAREARAAVPNAACPVADAAWERAAAIVHEEVGRLPPSLREAFVLCCLEGKTPDVAAEQLRLSRAALSIRLSRAKQRLLERLAVRGVGASVAFAALCDATPSTSALDRAVTQVNPSASVLSLLPGAVPMTLPHAKLLLVFAALAVGAFTLLLPTAAQDTPKASPPKQAEVKAKTDLHGDPLPEKAVMRLGTVKYRVPGIAGVGFKKTGELVVLNDRLEMHTFPADGGPTATVTRLWEQARADDHWRATLSADARFAAACLGEKRMATRLVVWDVSGAKPIELLSREMRDADLKGFSPECRWLVVHDTARGTPEPLLLADLTTKKWKALPVQKVGQLEQVGFTPDGKRLSVVNWDTVKVFDTATAELLLSAKIPNVTLHGTALSPDGKVVAAVPAGAFFGKNEEVRLLSVSDGKPPEGWIAPAVRGGIVGFTAGGQTLWTSGSGRVREWDLKTGKWIHDVPVPSGGVLRPSMPWSPDGKRFVTHNEHTVAFFDAKTWKPLHPDTLTAGPTIPIHGIVVSPDGKTIATDGEPVHLWDSGTGKLLGTVQAGGGVAFLPDSKTFLTVPAREPPVEYDARTGKELRRFKLPDDLSGKASLSELSLSTDGKTVETFASTESSRKAYRLRWDVAKGEVTGRAEANPIERDDEIMLGARSPDGEWKTIGGTVSRVDGTVKPIEVFPREEWSMNGGASWSADSKRVALPRAVGKTREEQRKKENNSLVVFDLAKNEKVTELPTGGVWRTAFSADGKLLGLTTQDRVAVWDVAAGKEVFAATADFGNIIYRRGITFTPDGKRIITSHGTHCLMWDVAVATNGK